MACDTWLIAHEPQVHVKLSGEPIDQWRECPEHVTKGFVVVRLQHLFDVALKIGGLCLIEDRVAPGHQVAKQARAGEGAYRCS